MVDKNALAKEKNLRCYNKSGLITTIKDTEGLCQMDDVKSLTHSKWRCKYHIVFAPKYRRKVIYKTIREDVIEIIKKLCREMKVEIIEGEACPDHIHLLVSIPLYMSIAQFVGTLKSKSALMIFDRHANLKNKYGSRNFWCRGYFVDTVGKTRR